MLAALLITLREGLEAALIVGVVLGALTKLGQQDQRRTVWAGVAAAVAVSVAAAVALQALGISFAGRGEQIFEGLAMLLAAVILTWMILWMVGQGREMERALERNTAAALRQNRPGMLFGLAFVAVVREGIETVLFLTASAMSQDPALTLIGGAIGLLAAVADVLPDLGEQIRASLSGAGGSGTPPWEIDN